MLCCVCIVGACMSFFSTPFDLPAFSDEAVIINAILQKKSPAVADQAAIVGLLLQQQLQFHNDNFILNYDNLDFITNTLMLDNSGPYLDYDMFRYVDEAFISSSFFYRSTLSLDSYSDYLRIFVEEYGKLIDRELYGA